MMKGEMIALAHMSNIFNFQLVGARFYRFYRKNLKKGAIIQKGRNNSKKCAIKGAIKNIAHHAQTIGIIRFSL